ncbi:uncharacterized protein PgNI_02433 [Pyricularia grisea]|uniref:Uncharacterized protein n=1 Tax=Pyricularia grisea TaxID=148305 RepID=A0A6P8BHR1_PYRGI|nr:uncharacterized protein PgNI_02433 [Pyricularia grisea]TLD16265.1 hypothetical protein PgNI_02433 [Pyricularia grisea]
MFQNYCLVFRPHILSPGYTTGGWPFGGRRQRISSPKATQRGPDPPLQSLYAYLPSEPEAGMRRAEKKKEDLKQPSRLYASFLFSFIGASRIDGIETGVPRGKGGVHTEKSTAKAE